MTLSTEDRLELGDLIARYALLVDRRDVDAAASLFLDTATLVLPDPPRTLEPVIEHTGRAAVRAALDRVTTVPRTFHAIVGTVLEPRPDGACGVVSCSAHHISQRPSCDVMDLVWHLRYNDDYVRTVHGWRIARRAAWIDVIETRPVRRWRGPCGDKEPQS